MARSSPILAVLFICLSSLLPSLSKAHPSKEHPNYVVLSATYRARVKQGNRTVEKVYTVTGPQTPDEDERPNPPPPPPKRNRKRRGKGNLPRQFLNHHNSVRAQKGLPPLVWDRTVARHARRWGTKRKGDCALIHSNTTYGENLFQGTGNAWRPVDAVRFWSDEENYYDPNANTCQEGKMCGHYTQVVWRQTEKLGCERVQCDGGKGIFVVCNYDPPGNYINESPFQ